MGRITLWRTRWFRLGGIILLLWLTTGLYGRSVGFGLLWDDPLWFGRVIGQSFSQMFQGDPTFQFYRPGAFLYNSLFLRADNTLNDPLLHLGQIAWHWLNISLIYTLVRRLRLAHGPALMVSALFALNPFSQQAVAWAAPQQPLALALQNGAWLTFLLAFRGLGQLSPGLRRGASAGWLAASYGMFTVALTIQESAIPLSIVPMLFGWFMWRERRDWLPAALGYLGLAIGYSWLWMQAPHLAGYVGLYGDRRALAYLLQGLTYPLWGHVWGYSADWSSRADLILALSGLAIAALLALAAARRRGQQAALGLLWALPGLAPFAIGLNYEYVSLAPRALYYAAPGVACMGVSALWGWKRGGGSLLLILCLVQSALLTARQQTLFSAGAHHLHAIVAAAQVEMEAGRDSLLFLNVPDRFRWRRPPFPLGYWGLPLAPVAADLGDFVALADGRHPQTLSLALPWIDEAERDAGPFVIDMRGAIVTPQALAQAAQEVDVVYLSHYTAVGRWELSRAGQWLSAGADGAACGLAWFGSAACLEAAETRWQAGTLWVRLVWRAGDSAEPHDTIFLHYGQPDQPPLAQSDGDVWQNTLPLVAWPRAGRLVDERRLTPPPGAQGLLSVGVYDWVTGLRLPIYTPAGAPWPTELVQLALPPEP